MKRILLIIFLIFFIVDALKVINITYTPKSKRVGVGDEINAYIYDLYFDGELYLKNNKDGNMTSLSDLNMTYDPIPSTEVNASVIPICMGKSTNRCPLLPKGLSMLLGSLILQCPDDKTISKIPYEDNVIYYVYGLGATNLDFLIPLNPTQNPFDNFVRDLLWFDGTDYAKGERFQKNKLSFMVLNTYVKESMKYTFRKRPSIIPHTIKTMNDIMMCRFVVNQNNTDTNYTLTDKDGNIPTGFELVQPRESTKEQKCSQESIVFAKEFISNITVSLPTARSWNELDDALWKQVLFMLTNKMSECANFINEKIRSLDAVGNIDNKGCYAFTQTAEWLSDPCCNPVYTWSNECCINRKAEVNLTVFAFPLNNVTDHCSTPDKSLSLLTDYISLRNIMDDPYTGCESAVQLYTYPEVSSNMDTALNCFYSIYNNIYACNDTSDCLCGYCDIMKGVCSSCNITSQAKAFETCYRNGFPTDVESLARKDWGLEDSSADEFFEYFFNASKTDSCVDQTGNILSYKNTSCVLGYCRKTNSALEYTKSTIGACTSSTFNGSCQVCLETGVCSQLPFVDMCLVSDIRYNDQSSCTGGSLYWDQFENLCYFRGSSAKDCQCSTGVNNNTLCNAGFCSNTTTKANCVTKSSDTVYKYYDDTLATCVIMADSWLTCTSVGGTWKSGRVWRPKGTNFNVTSQEQCDALGDMCIVNGKLISNCTNETVCIGRCPTCEPSTSSPLSICYNNLNRTGCIASQGLFDIDLMVCLFPYKNYSTCSGNGLIYENCSSLSYDQCEACSSDSEPGCPLYGKNILNCMWNSQKMCDQSLPQDQCEAKKYCHDQSLYPACAYTTGTLDNFGCPICVWSLRNEQDNSSTTLSDDTSAFKRSTMSNNSFIGLGSSFKAPLGEVYNTRVSTFNYVQQSKRNMIESYSIYGCITYSVNKDQCLATGAKWIKPLLTESECISLYGCKEKLLSSGCQVRANNTVATVDYFTNKTLLECHSCGGSYETVNTWRSGKITQPQKIYRTWQTELFSPYNNYVPYMNGEALNSLFSKYIYARISDYFSTAIDCNTAPIFQTSEILGCDCVSVDNNMFAPGACFASNTAISLGKHLVCRGDKKTVRIGRAILIFNPTSISLYYYCVRISLSFISATQLKSQEVVSTSSLLNTLTYKDNPYAIIKNKFGITVGQLISDGVDLTVYTNIFSSFRDEKGYSMSKRSSFLSKVVDVPNKNFTEANNLTLCIYARADIKNSVSDFPLMTFATTLDYINWYPLNIPNFTYDGVQYCGIISTNSTIIFPVSLTKDWETRNSIFTDNKPIRDVMYFLSGAMFVLFLACTITIIVQFARKPKFNISKISLIFLFVYSGVRASFFLLFAYEKLSNLSTSNPAGYFVLAELPYYVFISIFVLLIIFWWKISKSTAPILGLMVVPVFVVNLILYAFFVAVCVVAAVVKGNGATVLNKVYKIIVAAIAFALIMTAWIFGGIVLKSAYRGFRLRTKGRRAKIPAYLVRTFVILIVTSIALLFQIIYLLYVTFKTAPSNALAVAVYFLVEFIPAYILFILFALTAVKEKCGETSKKGSKHSESEPRVEVVKKKPSKYANLENNSGGVSSSSSSHPKNNSQPLSQTETSGSNASIYSSYTFNPPLYFNDKKSAPLNYVSPNHVSLNHVSPNHVSPNHVSPNHVSLNHVDSLKQNADHLLSGKNVAFEQHSGLGRRIYPYSEPSPLLFVRGVKNERSCSVSFEDNCVEEQIDNDILEIVDVNKKDEHLHDNVNKKDDLKVDVNKKDDPLDGKKDISLSQEKNIVFESDNTPRSLTNPFEKKLKKKKTSSLKFLDLVPLKILNSYHKFEESSEDDHFENIEIPDFVLNVSQSFDNK